MPKELVGRGSDKFLARVFFALWPDDNVRGALHLHAEQLRRGCGGRAMRRENLHLTLVFVGEVAIGRLDELKCVAGAVSVAPFELVVDQVGYWRHNRVVWASPLTVPAPLRELVAGLEDGLKQGEFDFDRRPYAPHITLLRDARKPRALPALGVPWNAFEFALVQSVRDDRGSNYQVVQSWPLKP